MPVANPSHSRSSQHSPALLAALKYTAGGFSSPSFAPPPFGHQCALQALSPWLQAGEGWANKNKNIEHKKTYSYTAEEKVAKREKEEKKEKEEEEKKEGKEEKEEKEE